MNPPTLVSMSPTNILSSLEVENVRDSLSCVKKILNASQNENIQKENVEISHQKKKNQKTGGIHVAEFSLLQICVSTILY